MSRLKMDDSEDIYFQCIDYQFYLTCLWGASNRF